MLAKIGLTKKAIIIALTNSKSKNFSYAGLNAN